MCLKLSPNLRKKAKVYSNLFSIWNIIVACLLPLKIRKGIEFPQNSQPEFDKLAQELARTVAGDAMNDILNFQTTDIED